MAKKGQRFNRYPEEFKEALRQAYLNREETCNSIARKYSLKNKTQEASHIGNLT